MGLDTPRSFVYGGICSLLAPSGYGRSREPDSQPFGLSLMPHLISGGNSHSRNTTATMTRRATAPQTDPITIPVFEIIYIFITKLVI